MIGRIGRRDANVEAPESSGGFDAFELRLGDVMRGERAPLGKSPVREDDVMTADTCARLILDAADARKREVVMTARGKLGQWVKLIAPSLVDRIAARAIETGA